MSQALLSHLGSNAVELSLHREQHSHLRSEYTFLAIRVCAQQCRHKGLQNAFAVLRAGERQSSLRHCNRLL